MVKPKKSQKSKSDNLLKLKKLEEELAKVKEDIEAEEALEIIECPLHEKCTRRKKFPNDCKNCDNNLGERDYFEPRKTYPVPTPMPYSPPPFVPVPYPHVPKPFPYVPTPRPHPHPWGPYPRKKRPYTWWEPHGKDHYIFRC